MEENNNVPNESELLEEPIKETDINLMSLEELKEALELTKQSVAKQIDSTQRAQAELANYKKRTEEQRISEIQFLNANLLSKLLPVSDEFDMAILQIDKDSAASQWVDGIKLIHKKIEAFLLSEGVSKIECEGEIFDPLQHEALSTEETNDYESGIVVKVLRNGYRLRDRVIQPAQVVVAKPVSN